MLHLVLGIHLLLCLAIIGIVLMQQGKGADMGAAFSGSSNTVFGAAGAGSMLVKITTGLVILFMITSIMLIRMYDNGAGFRDGPVDPLKGSLMGTVQPVTQEASAPAAAPASTGSTAQSGEPAPASPAAVPATKSDTTGK